MKAPRSLNEVLEMAILCRAKKVTLECDSSGLLEVFYFVENTGVGTAVSESADQQRIISELVDRAGLETRVRGTLTFSAAGKNQKVRVTERDHFGESAFDLQFGA